MEMLQKKLSATQMQKLKERIAKADHECVRQRLLTFDIDIDLLGANVILSEKLENTLSVNIPRDVQDAIVLGAIMGQLSAFNLNLLIDKVYLSPCNVERILLAIKDGKFSDITFNHLVRKSYWFQYKDFEGLLVLILIDGSVSEESFSLLCEKYRFKKSSWQALFESGISFLVKAYLQKFYPEIAFDV